MSDDVKNSLGPFEIFAGFVSGLPFMLVGYIAWQGKFDFDRLVDRVIVNPSVAQYILFLVASYLVGSIVGSMSYRYYKRVGKWLGMEETSLESKLLGDWEEPFVEVSLPQFTQMTFEQRAAYLIKRRYGKVSSLSHLNDYLVVYLRHHSSPNATKADGFAASVIMHRNLSLGFLLLSLTLAVLALTSRPFLFANVGFCLSALLLAVLTLLRAQTFRNWWAREAILGYYNVEVKCVPLFRSESEIPGRQSEVVVQRQEAPAPMKPDMAPGRSPLCPGDIAIP